MKPLSSLTYKLFDWRRQYKLLFTLCLMFLFWTLFDGMVSYVSPLAISQAHLSDTLVGIIIASSSVFGALFDLFLSKFLNNTHFRRVYILMFVLCGSVPLILWTAKSIPFFVLAMAIWGFYYDLMNFGTLDFVGRRAKESERATHFGRLSIFKELGYMLAPLVAGLVIGNSGIIDAKPIVLMYVFLVAALLFFVVVMSISLTEREEYIKDERIRSRNIFVEIYLWRRFGKILFPALILFTLLNIFDSFFWTLGPLIAQSYTQLKPFGGLFLTVYVLPSLLVGWFVGTITKKFGKRRTAYVAFFVSALILAIFSQIHNPYAILGDVFFSSIFLGLSFPSLDGAFSDYLAEVSRNEREIEAMGDFYTNIGYVVGPVAAGVLADKVGIAGAFSVLGIISAVCAALLFLLAPRKIHPQVSIPQSIE